MYKTLSILAITTLLSACGTNLSNTSIVLPPVTSYSQDFSRDFANELDQICGIPEKGVVDKMPRTCTFVRDSIVLRKRLKELEAAK